MGDLVFDAVPRVIEDEGTLSLLLLDGRRGTGIAVARRRGQARIGIPHHLLDLIAGVKRGDILGRCVDVAHVEVVVAVVAKKHQRVGPGAGIEIIGVGDDLVHHHFGLSVGGDGETSNGNVELVARGGIESLTVVEQAEESVVHIAVNLTEGILTLPAEQVIVGIEVLTSGGDHAVVPQTVAEEQQIFWRVIGTGGAVVEHLEITAVGIGVGRAA